MSTGLSAATNTSAVCERHCKVEGCTRELCLERPYYHRLGICAAHVREPQLLVDGQLKRFCQQCAKLHDVEDFDPGKRSCRLMLERHKARRRLRAKQARQQQHDCAGKELTTDSDPDRELTAAPSPKPTPLRRRGRNPAREVPGPTGGQSVVQFQLAHGGVMEPTMKTGRVVEGSPGSASCRDGISDYDGRSGSTCSQAETTKCRASSSQQDGSSELNGVPATMPREGEPGEQASSLVAPHVNQMLMTGQLLNRAPQLGPVPYERTLDNGFCTKNPGLNTRPGVGMHVAMPVCTPLTRPDHEDHKMEGGSGFAASPSSAPKKAFSSIAVMPSPPQHLWHGPLDLQPLDAVAKMTVHRDAALDIELASLLSELDSQPITYPPGTCCLASTSRPEYTNGGGYDGSGSSSTGARLHFGPCLLDKRGKDGNVGISPSFGRSGGMGASGVVCGLRQVDLEVPAFPYSQLRESSGAVVHPTPTTTVKSSAKEQTRVMQLPGCAPCSLSSAPHQSSLHVGQDPRPIRPQGWLSCGTPLAAMLPPAAFSSPYGAQEPAQQPDVVNFQPPLLGGRSSLVHASLPTEDGGLRQYSFHNISCEQQQQEHSLPQLPQPLWQQSKGELQQHCPWQEQQQYPCVNQQPEIDAQSPWEVARSSLMRGSGLPEADGGPAQYPSTTILNEGQWQQQQIPPFQALLQPQMQSPWPRSNVKPQHHSSPAAGAAALGLRQPKYK